MRDSFPFAVARKKGGQTAPSALSGAIAAVIEFDKSRLIFLQPVFFVLCSLFGTEYEGTCWLAVSLRSELVFNF